MRCYNCMKELPTDSASFCPFCDKNPKEQNPPHRLAAGTVLHNRYLVGATLGEGGFGITYVGFDQTLYIKVAVKEYYPSGIATRFNTISNDVRVSADRQQESFEKGKDSFLQEARSVAQFSNETGVVDVRDFFTENNTAYIVMEFLDGVDLNKHIHNNGIMEAKQTFDMMLPLMRTLEKMHRQNVIHRDISPDNIMLLKNGTLKLMDFGAARQYSRDESRSLSVVLKPGFAPFEQYSRKGKQGPWTDVYALCATIYACITGKAPSDSLDRSVADDLKKPSELGISIPENLEKALMKGLAVHRENRFQNMGELIEAIEEKPEAEKQKPEAKENLTIVADDKNIDENKTVAANDLDKDEQKTVSADAPVILKKPVDLKPVNNIKKPNEKKKRGKKALIISIVALILAFAIPLGVIFIKPMFDGNKKAETSGASSTANTKTTEASALETTNESATDVKEETLSINELKQIRESLPKQSFVSAGKLHIVGIKTDGTVCTVGDNSRGQCNVDGWKDIVAVSTGNYHTVGLKTDGTVVAVGWNQFGQCNVGDWNNIVAISAGFNHTIGLKANGTVVATGDNSFHECDVGGWKDIVAISTSEYDSMGIESNGTITWTGNNRANQCNVGLWKNIVAICAQEFHSVGLKADGTVVAVGDNSFGKCNVEDWNNIIAVSANSFHTVGLKKDNTVVAVGNNHSGRCDVSNWDNIEAVFAGNDYTIGIRTDGTVIACGTYPEQLNDWTNIKTN